MRLLSKNPRNCCSITVHVSKLIPTWYLECFFVCFCVVIREVAVMFFCVLWKLSKSSNVSLIPFIIRLWLAKSLIYLSNLKWTFFANPIQYGNINLANHKWQLIKVPMKRQGKEGTVFISGKLLYFSQMSCTTCHIHERAAWLKGSLNNEMFSRPIKISFHTDRAVCANCFYADRC